ncbi:MAG: hypothetical protein K9M44_04615, partial [Candidatus Pacebacteria bacterium]|nr:hypothetical protein [Candidatus Paceibacterota bacterium]
SNGSQVTAVANENYHFVSWSDGVLTASRSESSVSANISVTAQFAIDTYDLNYSASSGGTISGSSSQTINHGSNGSQVTAVANENYHFVSWSDGVLTASRSESSVSANISVTAQFEANIVSGAPSFSPKAVGSGSKNDSLPFGGSKDVGIIDNQGLNIFGYINSQANFEVSDSSGSSQGKHKLEIINLDLLTGILTLKVSSKPIVFSLEKGESRKIDLDRDGVDDASFTFANLYINRVEITIKDLNYKNNFENTNNIDINNQDIVFNKNNFLIQEKLKLKTIDLKLSERLKGRILLQVEDLGQAWYVEPVSLQRYYMKNGEDAYNIMKDLGVGISNLDLKNIKTDINFAKKHQGKIFLQVEDLGQAYYIDFQGKAHYLKNGDSAYNIMKNLGLGIKNSDLYKIDIS